MDSETESRGSEKGANRLTVDPRKADAAYTLFPSFSEWASTTVDEPRWDRYTRGLNELRTASTEMLLPSLEIVKRAAAFDTGALEGLYDTDRGLTFTVATEAAMWEAAVDSRNENARPLFEAQLKAYDSVLDLATQAVPIAEAWIRELHRQICEAQETYRALTELGWQELKLPKGKYKSLPNHVLLADGRVHSYAPVDITPAEMYRLCQQLQTEQFGSAHPALQASYAHYALTVVHPFADGNGRVARALASVFTYRCCSVPVMVLSENQEDYLAALRAADAGYYQLFVTFVAERTLDAVQLARTSIAAAVLPSMDESIKALKDIYKTTGGYTQPQVDSAGVALLDLFHREIELQLDATLASGEVNGLSRHSPYQDSRGRPGYRAVNGEIHLSLSAGPSGRFVRCSTRVGVYVPEDCGKEDDVVLCELERREAVFEARITELLPAPSAALQARLSVWVEGLLRAALVQLSDMARNSLK